MIQLVTLSDHLSFHGISKKEACELFGRTERTLKRWENEPPKWVLRIVQLLGKKPPFPDCWNGWYFDQEYICDPALNKYHISEVSNIFYTRQLTESIMGKDYQVQSLKLELEKRLKALSSSISVSVSIGDAVQCFNVAL